LAENPLITNNYRAYTRIWTKYGINSTPAQTVFVILFLSILLIHHHVVTGAYVCLCLWALVGPKQAIKALSLNYLILLLNQAIYTLSPEVSLLRWIILYIAGLRVAFSFSRRAAAFVIALLLFFLMITVLAFWTSPSFQISFSKITVFTYGVATFLIAFNSLDKHSLMDLKDWFLAISVAVVLISLPTLFLPSVGYLCNGRGFQGVFNHPQGFGVFLAPIIAYLASKIFLLRSSEKLWVRLFGAIAFLVMFLSRSRTAMLTVLISLGSALVAGTLSPHHKVMQMAALRTLTYIASGLIILFALIVISPVFSKTIEGFWLKGEENTTLEEAFYRSRGAGIDFHWNRFLQKPLTGHGFGIDAAHGIKKNPESFLGIAVSSPTEKGFLPVAFLEEVGIIGLLFFMPFFLILCWSAVSQPDMGLISIFFACLFVNIGEAVFFSPGYLGGYLWLLIGLSTAPGWKKNHQA